MHNLCVEIPSISRGPKAPAPNLGWNVGLQEITIDISRSCLLLTGTHLSSASKSAMTKCAAKVADATSEMLEDSLKYFQNVCAISKVSLGRLALALGLGLVLELG